MGSGKIQAWRSPALKWTTQIGAELSPEYMQDYGAIRSRVAKLYKDTMNGKAEGRFIQVIEKRGWSIRNNTTVDTPSGTTDLTAVTEKCIKAHCKRAWMRYMLLRCDNRASRSDNTEGKRPLLVPFLEYRNKSKTWLGRFIATGACPDWRTFTGMYGEEQ